MSIPSIRLPSGHDDNVTDTDDDLSAAALFYLPSRLFLTSYAPLLPGHV